MRISKEIKSSTRLCRLHWHTYFDAGLVISCQTSCTRECVSVFLSLTADGKTFGIGSRLAEPVTTSALLESRGDAGGVNDVGPELAAGSHLSNTDSSAGD